MAEDSDKKPGKIIKDSQQALIKSQQDAAKKAEVANTYQNTSLKENAKVNKENLEQTKALVETNKRALTLNETVKTLQEQKVAADELRATGNIDVANQIDAQIESTRKALFKQDGTLKNLTGATNKVGNNIINAAANDAAQIQTLIDANRELSQQQIDGSSAGFNDFVANLKEGQKANEVNDDMIEKALKDLGPRFGGVIDPAFEEFNNRLSDIQQMEADGLLTQEQSNVMRKELLDATTDREKQREAQKAAELQGMALTKMGDSIEGLGGKLAEFGQGAVKSAGLLGGIAALVLGVVDPEKFTEIVVSITNGFMEIVQGFMALLEGDFATFKTKIMDNFALFGGLILGLAFYFGGPLITAVGGLFKKLAIVVRAMKAFRLFMITSFIPGMMSAFSAITTALAPVLAPLLPIIAIIAVLAGAFMLIKNYLGEGASITDTLKYAMLLLLDGLGHIVNAFTFIPRKIFGFFGERIGKFLLGDDFKMPDFITKGMKTNRAAEFKKEIDERPRKPNTSEIDGEIKEQQDLELPEGVEIPENLDGAMILDGDDALDSAKIAVAQGGATVNAPQITANTQQNTQSTTNISYNPPSFGTMQLITHYTGRA